MKIKNRPAHKFKSLSDAYQMARVGDQDAQRCIIGCLSNLGCDHLANGRSDSDCDRWLRYWRGLEEYIEALCCEYGVEEGQAERDVLGELNAARGYSSGVEL